MYKRQVEIEVEQPTKRLAQPNPNRRRVITHQEPRHESESAAAGASEAIGECERTAAAGDLGAEVGGRIKLGRRSYNLDPQTKSVPSGSAKNVKLKPAKSKDAVRIAKALRKGRKATAKLTVALSDGVGNLKSSKLSVKLKR